MMKELKPNKECLVNVYGVQFLVSAQTCSCFGPKWFTGSDWGTNNYFLCFRSLFCVQSKTVAKDNVSELLEDCVMLGTTQNQS